MLFADLLQFVDSEERKKFYWSSAALGSFVKRDSEKSGLQGYCGVACSCTVLRFSASGCVWTLKSMFGLCRFCLLLAEVLVYSGLVSLYVGILSLLIWSYFLEKKVTYQSKKKDEENEEGDMIDKRNLIQSSKHLQGLNFPNYPLPSLSRMPLRNRLA